MIFRPSLLALLALPLAAQEPIRGFTPAGAKRQLDLESKAIASIEATRIGQHIKTMSAKPHAAGSLASKEVASYALDQFRKFGLDPAIASGPFVATFVDVTGIAIFFLIAKAILL